VSQSLDKAPGTRCALAGTPCAFARKLSAVVRRTMLAAGVVALMTAGASGAAELSLNDVSLLAVTKSKAIVKIGKKRYVLKQGQRSPEGVLLVRSDSGGATFSLNGVEETLAPGLVTESVKTERELKRERKSNNPVAAKPKSTTVDGFWWIPARVSSLCRASRRIVWVLITPKVARVLRARHLERRP